MSFTSLGSVQVPENEATLLPAWGDFVNSNFDFLYAQVLALQALVANGIPVGAVQAYAAALTAPNSGWLVCDGSAISRTAYTALFSAFSTQWGAGDGVTTFNLPDARAGTIVGASLAASAGLTPRALTARGGQSTHTLLTAELPVHNHGITDQQHSHSGTTANQSTQHNHAYPGVIFGEASALGLAAYNSGLGAGSAAVFDSSGATRSGPDLQDPVLGGSGHTHTFVAPNAFTGISSTQGAGSGTPTADNNMPPYLAMTWMIKCS